MNDLIERDRAMKVAMWFGTSEQKYNHSFIKKRVMEIPSIRPKKGRWVNIYQLDLEGRMIAQCSNCREKIYFYGDTPNFCQQCGADMRERKETDYE